MSSQAQSPWFLRWLDPGSQGHRISALQTRDLLLRPPKMQDAADFHAYARDPLVARYVLWDPHTSLSQSRSVLRSLITHSKMDSLHTLSIVRQSDRRMIGTIGLVWRDWQNNSAEVGFSMARDCWGQGLMSQALTVYLQFGFAHLKLNRIEAQHDSRNPASGRVMEKAGMEKEGLLKKRMQYKGAYADIVLYAALRESWLEKSGDTPR